MVSSDCEDKGPHQVGIADAFRTLPLFDELYLGMQAMNLDIIDEYLEQQEKCLLDDYIELEKTPFPGAIFVSALSQMWIFALYELLRTWRQRAGSIIRWSKELQTTSAHERESRLAAKKREIQARAAKPDWTADFYLQAHERATNDPAFVESLRKAKDRTEGLFRRIEALRVSLAKHEMPHINDSYAMAPGYGRIDMVTGSIYWQLVLRGNEIDLVSRRGIADECRRLALATDALILSDDVQEMIRIKKIPDQFYGVKRVAVVLDDGSTYSGVHVGWGKELLWVEGHGSVPFEGNRVTELRHDPLPEQKSGE